jgi:hypothetical protein
MSKKIEEDYEELINKFKDKPGIEDLLALLKTQTEIFKETEYYLDLTSPKVIYTASDSAIN